MATLEHILAGEYVLKRDADGGEYIFKYREKWYLLNFEKGLARETNENNAKIAFSENDVKLNKISLDRTIDLFIENCENGFELYDYYEHSYYSFKRDGRVFNVVKGVFLNLKELLFLFWDLSYCSKSLELINFRIKK
jgi:hypothetical protein